MDVKLEDDGEYQCQAGATSIVKGIRSRSATVTVVSEQWIMISSCMYEDNSDEDDDDDDDEDDDACSRENCV